MLSYLRKQSDNQFARGVTEFLQFLGAEKNMKRAIRETYASMGCPFYQSEITGGAEEVTGLVGTAKLWAFGKR